MIKSNIENYKFMIGKQLDGEVVQKSVDSKHGLKTATHFVINKESIKYLELPRIKRVSLIG